MPTNLIRPANSWNVAVQGESNWRCRIKHMWQYLEEDKLRACERCGQMMGRRDYLNWVVGPWDELSRAGKQLQRDMEFREKRILPPKPNPPPAPPPKRTPWHDREQFELMNNSPKRISHGVYWDLGDAQWRQPLLQSVEALPPHDTPLMESLRKGVELSKPEDGFMTKLFKSYKAHGVPYRPYGDGPQRKNWIGLHP